MGIWHCVVTLATLTSVMFCALAGFATIADRGTTEK